VSTGLVATLFITLNVLFVYAMPLEKMKGQVAIGSIAASYLFSPEVTGLFSGAMALSLLATVNAMVTIGPRVYYAMAKNGAFFAAAANVHPRWHTPATAIICQGICTILMTTSSFVNLMFYLGFALNFFAVMSVASLFVFRRRPGWRKIGVVSFAYPLVPLFFSLGASWMTVFGMTFKPLVSLIAAATVGAGAIVYHTHFRKRAV